MRRTLRALLLALCLTVCCLSLNGARAEVVSLGVTLTGLQTDESGAESILPLSGRFRVLQNGVEAGTLTANGGVLTLTSLERIRLEPMVETLPAGWDWSGAAVEVVPQGAGVMTVPIQVREQAALPEATEVPEATPEATAEPAPAAEETPGEEIEPQADIVPQAEPAPAEAEAEDEPIPAAPATTPELRLTAVPTVAPTPEPVPAALTGGEGTGAVRVLVFNDKNTNGEQGAYEEGLQDIPVYLLAAEGEETLAVGRTDAEGLVLFENVPVGDCRIRAFIPSGWGFTQPGKDAGLIWNCMPVSVLGEATSGAVSVAAGQTAERGVAVGKMIHVGGFCWLETEADGIRKAGEQMLPGIRITLEGQKNGLFYETTTDETGSWLVDRVRPGFYTITAWAPEGMMFTRYSRTGGDNRSIFTTEGVTKASRTLDTNDKVSRDDQNIGFMWSSEIAGQCFLDLNYNGLYDEGEPPLAGVKVTAIKQVKDEEIAVAWSGEDGRYILPGLRGNTYRVRAVLPEDGADFTRVVSDPEGNHFQARVGRRENFWNDFTLGDAQQRTVNVGAIYPASLSGTAYLDDDFSATHSGAEKTVSGLAVSLLDENGAVVATDKTDAKGRYHFSDLVPGNYSLRVNALEGYAFTRQGEGNVVLNRSRGEGYSELFFLNLGEDRTGLDMGMIHPGTVEGTVFADANDNGLLDAGETGMTGTVVRLMSEEGEAFRAEIGNGGGFTFDAVMPGRYQVTYELPEEAVFARGAEGGNQIASGSRTGESEWFDFPVGGYQQAPLCGALTLGRISGSVFSDPNGNGIQEEGEPALDAVTLTLTPSRAELDVLSVTSDESGLFALEGLRPDAYAMTLSIPAPHVLSRTDAVSLPFRAGYQEQTVSLEVAMGARWENQCLGIALPVSLSGRVWLDENNDGRMDPEEATPAGCEIVLTDEVSGLPVETLRTDEQGAFGTGHLIPGSYGLSYTLPRNTLGAGAGDSLFLQDGGQMVLQGIALRENESADDLLLGLVKYTAVGGTVWIDRGNGPEPLPGAVVSLLDEAGTLLQSMSTGETGGYTFDGLMPGTYQVTADMPAGCVVVEPGDARLTGSVHSVAERTEGRHGESAAFALRMGEDQLAQDFGCVLPGRLGDFCWVDLNGDGLQDYSEPGLPGVTVELLRDGQTVASTVSDQYGFYRFEEIYPAVYTLRVTPPAQVRATVRRTDLRIIASVLEEADGSVFDSVELPVESDRANYNADLGFVLRTEGVLPEGLWQGKTQDWTSFADSEN